MVFGSVCNLELSNLKEESELFFEFHEFGKLDLIALNAFTNKLADMNLKLKVEKINENLIIRFFAKKEWVYDGSLMNELMPFLDKIVE